MERLRTEYRACFSDRNYLFSFCLSFFYLLLALAINIYAAAYATVRASSPVTDIILSNTRAYDVDGFFVFGGLIILLIIIIVCLAYPRRIPFALKTIALFVLIRSVFITLTHIGPFPTEITIDRATAHYARDIIGRTLYKTFFSGNDLFFSGYTGLPFLMAFISWDNKWLRYMFILISVTCGVTALLGHLHYTIDVLAAFFITATIFKMAKFLFKKEYAEGRYNN